MAVSADAQTREPYKYNIPFVIGASAAGTTIEWYDFYLYGVLATLFASQFYPPGNEVTALLATLATFGAGFAVRPFGAVFFGRIGDLVGRKFTFLVTISPSWSSSSRPRSATPPCHCRITWAMDGSADSFRSSPRRSWRRPGTSMPASSTRSSWRS